MKNSKQVKDKKIDLRLDSYLYELIYNYAQFHKIKISEATRQILIKYLT